MSGDWLALGAVAALAALGVSRRGSLIRAPTLEECNELDYWRIRKGSDLEGPRGFHWVPKSTAPYIRREGLGTPAVRYRLEDREKWSLFCMLRGPYVEVVKSGTIPIKEALIAQWPEFHIAWYSTSDVYTGDDVISRQAQLSFDTDTVGTWLVEHASEAYTFSDNTTEEPDWALVWNGPPIPPGLLTFEA